MTVYIIHITPFGERLVGQWIKARQNEMLEDITKVLIIYIGNAIERIAYEQDVQCQEGHQHDRCDNTFFLINSE